MNPQERLQLDKLIRANDVADNTNQIRELKHSQPLKDDIITLLKLKQEYQRLAKSNPQQFDTICVSRCSFLFNNYTDIFNKVKKDEIDLNILFQLLHVLKLIEDGKLDQHSGSFEVGKLLKSIYIDSALKKADHSDKNRDKHSKTAHAHAPVLPPKKISWAEFKKTQTQTQTQTHVATSDANNTTNNQ